jgi:hypothetical protein
MQHLMELFSGRPARLYAALAVVMGLAIPESRGGGIRGTVQDEEGMPLPWASIYVKQIGTGTVANENGYYEISLPPGRYDIVFQHLGYESQQHQVEIDQDFMELHIRLRQQVIVLQNVTVTAGNEDPAYTIMRKAIAKAKYHTQQVDSFSARVYIKGSGKLKDYPWLAKKALEEEGIRKNRVFVSETISDILYRRPNRFEQKVISIRSDGRDNNTSPNAFIFGSFYQPVIGETISPLSPSAFAYYKFEYQGTFKDQNYDVSKIRVIPRTRGDNVVEGMLYIVEDWWSIHSLDFTTTRLGFVIAIKQMYAPIEEKAWMPVTQHFFITGRFFGFEFEYTYLATVSNYRITLNPELVVQNMVIIDEKLQNERARELEKMLGSKKQPLQQRLEQGEEITRRELKSLMKEYERKETKEQDNPEVIGIYNVTVDSGAYKKDSTYWAVIRPIPLTEEEIKGYRITDSLAIEERKKEEGDTLMRSANNKEGFQPWDLIIGDYYKLGRQTSLLIEPLQTLFNPAEGFVLLYRTNWGIALSDTARSRINFRPTFRYAFARKQLSGTLRFQLRNRWHRIQVEGGRYVQQFNPDEPILPAINTLTSLMNQNNFMKIYEHDFISLYYQRTLTPKLRISTHWLHAYRRELFNLTNYSWSRKNTEGYTPNAPENLELSNTGFPDHYALTGSVDLTFRPWVKYYIRNGRKNMIENSSPAFSIRYVQGFPALGSKIDFNCAEFGYRHIVKVGVRGELRLNLQAGKFFRTDSLAFMDYRHFMGNLTPIATTDPISSFRLLDYYRHSTAREYLVFNANYQFRKFLFSSIYKVHLLGIRESLFLNYLGTPTSDQYTEVGYGLNGIFRLFRLEVAAAFRNQTFVQYGFRVGIASSFAVRFSDN